MYVNLITREYIDDSAVVAETSNGLVYYENNCWKYLPSDRYDKTDSSTYNFTIVKSASGDAINSIAEADEDMTERHIFYTNYFGLSKFELSQRKYRENSGIMTGDMNVTPYRPLKLLVEAKIPEKTSIEFSIIDGTEEYPILPEGVRVVTDEKVFLGTSPRFRSYRYHYSKDFKSIGYSLSEKEIQVNDALYTVSYMPEGDAYTCKPSHSTVKVKAILRIYDENAEPPVINSIVLSQEA